MKPTIDKIAQKHIEHIDKEADYKVKFRGFQTLLFWPDTFSTVRLDQVIAETFDANDWHYYQKEHTKIEKDDILLDVGTAEGLFPLTVIDKCKHVYMIEPSRIFYKSLQQTFSAYTGKLTIFHVAVGNEDGVISFDEDSLDGKVAEVNTDSTYKIDISKIDSLFKNNERITYLKADIEGFEEQMLKGAEQTIKRNKPKIAITTYHTQNNPDEIISIIKGFVPEYNYYVKGIYEKTPKPVMIHFWI